jgi:uncharacterized repeat protein (TIGR01451 family)
VVSPNAQTNTATISHSDQFDPNTSNNSASATITSQQADLALTKTVSNATPNVGDTIAFTVTLSNNGPNAATNVTVQDALPAGLALVSATPSQGTYSSGTWTLGTVAPSAAATLMINAKVVSPNAQTNTATIAHSDQFDPNTSNNSASATINAGGVSAPTISESFTPTLVSVNGMTSLTFTLGNPNGGTTLTGVAFTDNFPTGLAVASPNGLNSTCTGTSTATAGTTSYALSGGTLSPGASCTVTLNVVGTTAGAKVNTTSAVTSNQTPPGAPATASLTVGAVSGTTTTLTSSANPSMAGQGVTFTAAATSGSGTPTGTVSFKDGGAVLGTATLVGGVAIFTTSTLTIGTHTITAAYAGNAGFSASTSGSVTQTVQQSTDSVHLRALQLVVSKLEAQASGDSFSGAVAGAIADGFADGGDGLIRPSGNGIRFNFAAEPEAGGQGGERASNQRDPGLASPVSALRDSSLITMNQNLPASVRSFVGQPIAAMGVEDPFAKLAYAQPMATKAPALPPPVPKEWQLWADVRGTGWNTDPSAGDIRGGQVNAIVGLTRKLTPDFLLGVLGGYENFDYSSDTLNGRLKGDGWTVGGYLGWRPLPGLRFDAAVGRSGISYDGVSGMAAATFPGQRWLASGGFTGTYHTLLLEIEPSAKVYAIWERDSSYIDSLGALQTENSFSTGRASAGSKVAYPMQWSAGATIAPYVGLYADYYFSSDNAVLLLPTQFVHGWAARTTAGVSYSCAGGSRFLIGGEVGGLGSQNFTTWSVRGRASVPF